MSTSTITTIFTNATSDLGTVLVVALPAAIGIGILLFGLRLGWRYFKRLAK